MTLEYYHDEPIFNITVNGQNVTSRFDARLVSLTLRESRDDEADQLDIVLSDHDNAINLPPLDAVLELAIGYRQLGLIKKGKFNIDELQHSGAPDQLTIRARSCPLNGAMRERKERSFHKKSVEEIIKTIALQNRLEAVVDKTIAKHVIEHIDQTNESDHKFLARLGKQFDAVATVKDGKLIFIKKHDGKTATGKNMPIIGISRNIGDRHNYSEASRDAYPGVVAKWQDIKSQKTKKVVVGTEKNAKKIQKTYGSEADALRAAKSEYERLKRGEVQMRFSMAHGRPDLSVQVKIQFPDMKPPISSHTFLIKTVTHKLDKGSGLTSDLELELESEKEEQPTA
ncbi:hypothetical protein AAEX37_01002 [Oligella sp. MSHR50489EDL]|uniref:contractile injection system protein, VgrG/Pvc8 family n=1 Tax=Oligella sp. MSHR50489EDL TaxID=3139409 RepID=UPI003D813C7D